MNDRYTTIDNFLKYIRDIELQNPGFIDAPRANNNVYSQLIRIGVKPQERNFKMPDNGLFDNWIQRFANTPNINVFVSPNWRYFCQFKNDDGRVVGSSDHIKVYIPQDSLHIEQSANMIFDFLAKNNIPHLSKIGSDIRFDDIVIRLINPEDEIKLREFVNNNQYIQAGLIPANPFLFQIDGIALACDGSISFNSTVASYITLYIRERKKQNKLNNVGISDFYTFVQDYYQRTFIDKTNIQNIKSDFGFDRDLISNYMNVTELLLKCIDKKFGYSDYIDHFNKCNNDYLMYQQETALENCYAAAIRNQQQRNYGQTERLITNQMREETNQMLLRVINVLKIRYQPETNIRIQKYLETGNVNYIPGDDPNLRRELANSSFLSDLKQILASDRVSLDDYISNVSRTMSNNNQQVDELLDFSYKALCEKYGPKRAIYNLEQYLYTGDSTFLTRNRNARQIISNSTFRNDMLQVLNGKSLQDYMNAKEGPSKSKDEILREALTTTFNKYEKAYQDGKATISGSEWIYSALAQLISKGSYNGFTRDNQARDNVMNNITSSDALEIISQFYGVNKTQGLTPDVISAYIHAYVSDVVNQMVTTYQY